MTDVMQIDDIFIVAQSCTRVIDLNKIIIIMILNIIIIHYKCSNVKSQINQNL